jgi:SPP1 gp7 family putative phage head morphogenesis protein
MATGYDEVFRAEKKAVPGDKVKEVNKPARLIMGATIPAIAATSASKFRSYTDSGIKQAMADNLDPYLAIAGSRKIGYKDGAVHARDRSADAHISNSVYAGASDGRTTAYKEKGIEKQRWLATLDDRTCAICGARDGKAYDIDDSPAQPAHTRCRCVYTPDVDTEARRGALVGEDVNKAYTVKPGTTYEKWLSNQAAPVKKEILGKTRFDLYTRGELKLSRFSDPLTGKRYTIEQLETLEKEAFSKL